ncbi:hypothetical protein [Novipirellula artificiosorum]|uniref:Uncharacterized protein n=1 Tax=Novipirellula artificiosorum TaxID=2528016 RepID=A0A5C6D7S7_9BACT|nr:hypothetical protein [Novipirellula artificiosorum]TWU33243.1 hypothetical protein Poly41_49950 [Novipirellula artificiosorum]
MKVAEKSTRHFNKVFFEGDPKYNDGSFAVYWYEEPGGEGEKIQLPRDWWVDYRVGEGDWTRMKKYVTDNYGLQRDKFNVVRHPSTTGLGASARGLSGPCTPGSCDKVALSKNSYTTS